MVFPRTQIWIEKQNQPRYLSHPNLVNFYNGTQEYVRYRCREYDDICDWFEFSPAVISEAMAFVTGSNHEIERSKEYPDISQLELSHFNATADIYLKQRILIDGLFRGKVSQATAQLISMELLNDALYSRCKKESKNSLSLAKRLRYQDIAASTEQYLLSRLTKSTALNDMAKVIGVSPFHLCRIFKLINGVSILEFKLQLKLRLSLHELADCRNITELALNHGFASHSHYSTKFKRVFGCTPAQFKKQIVRKV